MSDYEMPDYEMSDAERAHDASECSEESGMADTRLSTPFNIPIRPALTPSAHTPDADTPDTDTPSDVGPEASIDVRTNTKANIQAFFTEMNQPDLLEKVLEPICCPRFGEDPYTFPDCVPHRLYLAKNDESQYLWAWLRVADSGQCWVRFSVSTFDDPYAPSSTNKHQIITDEQLIRMFKVRDQWYPPFGKLMGSMKIVRRFNIGDLARFKSVIVYMFFSAWKIYGFECTENTCFCQGLFTACAMLDDRRGMIGKAEAKPEGKNAVQKRACGCVPGPQKRDKDPQD